MDAVVKAQKTTLLWCLCWSLQLPDGFDQEKHSKTLQPYLLLLGVCVRVQGSSVGGFTLCCPIFVQPEISEQKLKFKVSLRGNVRLFEEGCSFQNVSSQEPAKS